MAFVPTFDTKVLVIDFTDFKVDWRAPAMFRSISFLVGWRFRATEAAFMSGSGAFLAVAPPGCGFAAIVLVAVIDATSAADEAVGSPARALPLVIALSLSSVSAANPPDPDAADAADPL